MSVSAHNRRWLALACVLTTAACGRSDLPASSADLSARSIRAVATTTIVADLVARVGGTRVAVTALMGPGIDPHLYKASEGDVGRMASADIVFYNGLHLEGRMSEVFEQMARRGIRTTAVAAAVDPARLLHPAQFQGNPDPHVWFDVTMWMQAVGEAERALREMDPAHQTVYQTNAASYLAQLRALDEEIRDQAARVPRERRVLITAHDAFNYFGRAYGFEVLALQGISTATEAGTADVQRLADVIAERRIPAIFVESSVPPRGIEAVQAAVRARGFQVAVGQSLFSDALGDRESPEGTFIGATRHNVNAIVGALLAKPGMTGQQ